MRKIKVVQIGAEHDHAGFIMETMRRLDDVYEAVGHAVPDDEVCLSPQSYDYELNLYKLILRCCNI